LSKAAGPQPDRWRSTLIAADWNVAMLFGASDNVEF